MFEEDEDVIDSKLVCGINNKFDDCEDEEKEDEDSEYDEEVSDENEEEFLER